MRRKTLGCILALGTAAASGCSGSSGSNGSEPNRDGGAGPGDALVSSDAGNVFTNVEGGGGCTNIACNRVQCPTGQTTTVSGTVYDPAAKVPLYNVVVYVPNAPLDPLPSNGATCDQCGGTISGSPIVTTLTDAKGNFVLQNVPSGTNVPLVMQLGKWRREVMLPSVPSCTATVVTDHDLTRLPRNQTEGSIPRIAITTGGADPLECLLRKVGVDDSEFSTAGGPGRVHLYAGGSWTDGQSVNHPAGSSFASTLNGGAAFAGAASLWGSVSTLQPYDMVLMACEGELNDTAKPPAARQALYDYEGVGGRVFASHWHRFWFSDGPSPVPSVGAWMDQPDPAATGVTATAAIDTSFPKGLALRDWLVNVGASTIPGQLPIKDSKDNLSSVDPSEAQQWITMPNPNALSDAGGKAAIEYMTFNTPIQQPASAQCGRVVYSDLHVSSGDVTGQPFPAGCITTDLSPQEKALEFMLFDLSSCVQSDTVAPVVPK
jgi:hypothetical protein